MLCDKEGVGGNIYNTAIKWGSVKIVDPDWITACAEKWKRLNEIDFPVASHKDNDIKVDSIKAVESSSIKKCTFSSSLEGGFIYSLPDSESPPDEIAMPSAKRKTDVEVHHDAIKRPLSQVPRRVFLLGKCKQEDFPINEDTVINAISALGGEFIKQFDDNCTHLIMWTLQRTEKFLCCCASRKKVNYE